MQKTRPEAPLDLSPFFDAVYEGAAALNLPLETLLSEYAPSQFELTLRYGDLDRAVDGLILTKRLIRATARRFGMDACYMAKTGRFRSILN